MAESANVDILINAFTDAAEEALDDVSDDLNDLAADAQPAQIALDDVADELDDTTTSGFAAGEALDSIDAASLAAAMELLESRADEAGDEIAQAGRAAALTSGLFDKLSVSSGAASFGIYGLSTAMTASLIPSLLTLSTLLLPLAGILGGAAAAAGSLVAVFGGLTAVGIITHMEELKSAFQAARTEILAIIQPLGDVFGPLLVDAVQALPELVRRIVASLGPLDQFAATLRELGGVAMRIIPQMTAVMFDLAEMALPLVIDALEWLQANGGSIMASIGEAVDRLGPSLVALGSALADLLPDLFDLGIVVGELVIPALTDILGVIEDVVEFVLGLSDGLRDLSVATAVSAPGIVAVASALGSLSGPVGIAAAAVIALAAAFKTNFAGIRDAVMGLIGEFEPIFRIITDTLDRNSGKIQEFATMAQNALNTVATVLRTVVLPAIRFVFQNFVLPLLRRLAMVWSNHFGTILRETIETIDAIQGYIQPVLSALRAFWNRWGDEIMTTTRFLFDVVIGIVGTAMDAIFTTIIVLMNIIQGDWGEAWDAIKGFFIDTLNGMVSFIREWEIGAAILGVLQSIGQFFADLFTDTLPEIVIDGMAFLIGHITAAMNHIHNLMVSVWNAIVNVAGAAVEGLVNTTIDALNAFLSTLDGVSDAVSEIPGVDAPNVGRLGRVNLSTAAIEAQRRSTDAQALTREAEADINAAVTLTVEGSGALADLVREQASAEVEARNRQDTRRTRRQTGLR